MRTSGILRTPKKKNDTKEGLTLQGINISHLAKRKIIFKMPFWGDMLVPWRVFQLDPLMTTNQKVEWNPLLSFQWTSYWHLELTCSMFSMQNGAKLLDIQELQPQRIKHCHDVQRNVLSSKFMVPNQDSLRYFSHGCQAICSTVRSMEATRRCWFTGVFGQPLMYTRKKESTGTFGQLKLGTFLCLHLEHLASWNSFRNDYWNLSSIWRCDQNLWACTWLLRALDLESGRLWRGHRHRWLNLLLLKLDGSTNRWHSYTSTRWFVGIPSCVHKVAHTNKHSCWEDKEGDANQWPVVDPSDSHSHQPTGHPTTTTDDANQNCCQSLQDIR